MFGARFATGPVLVLLATSFSACSGSKSGAVSGAGGSAAGGSGGAAGAPGGTGGSSGTGGAAGTSADAGPGPGDGGADLGPAGTSCPQMPAPLRQSGTILELPIELTYAGQPFVFGEPNAVAGGTVTPLNLRFYISQAQLLTAGGGSVPVDILNTKGMPEYGVFLFNAEDAGAQTLRVLAPQGSYTGLTFALGLSPACNMGSPAGRSYPLSTDSQMTWPHGFGGYLFLRYDSIVASNAGADGSAVRAPASIHMGGDLTNLTSPSAIVVRLEGALSVPATSSARRGIRVAMDQIFKGATTDVDISGFPFTSEAEMVAGERLRRAGPALSLFSF